MIDAREESGPKRPEGRNMNEDVKKAKGAERTKIKAVPKPAAEASVTAGTDLASNILNAAIAESLDVSKLEGFSTTSQTREQIYRLIDMMGQDSTVAAILETYAEDAAETNDQGQVV